MPPEVNTMSTNENQEASEGFTLLELQVVFVVVAVLAALVFPAFCRAKAQARSISCRNNTRQIGMAVIMYVGDFQKYPMANEWGLTAILNRGQGLLEYISRTREIILCPAKDWDPSSPISPLSYGYNGLGSGTREDWSLGLGYYNRHDRYVAESAVKAPVNMILLGDSGTGMLSDWLLNPNADLDGPLSMGPPIWLPSDRHTAGANMVFCDGHVEFGKQSLWLERSPERRKRWNNDGQPHPETWKLMIGDALDGLQ